MEVGALDEVGVGGAEGERGIEAGGERCAWVLVQIGAIALGVCEGAGFDIDGFDG